MFPKVLPVIPFMEKNNQVVVKSDQPIVWAVNKYTQPSIALQPYFRNTNKPKPTPTDTYKSSQYQLLQLIISVTLL